MKKSLLITAVVAVAGTLAVGAFIYGTRSKDAAPEDIITDLLGDKVEIVTKLDDEDLLITVSSAATPTSQPQVSIVSETIPSNSVDVTVDEDFTAILEAAKKAASMKNYSYERTGDYKNSYKKCQRSGNLFYVDNYSFVDSNWELSESFSINLTSGIKTDLLSTDPNAVSDSSYSDIEQRWPELDLYKWLVTELYDIVNGYSFKGKDKEITILKDTYGEDDITVSSVTAREEAVTIRNMDDFTYTDLSYFVPQNYDRDTFIIEVECSGYDADKVSNFYMHNGKQLFYLDKETGMLVHWRYYNGESLSTYFYFY